MAACAEQPVKPGTPFPRDQRTAVPMHLVRTTLPWCLGATGFGGVCLSHVAVEHGTDGTGLASDPGRVTRPYLHARPWNEDGQLRPLSSAIPCRGAE